MMDDFIEQDWFAESEDINNKHHPVAVHEQQSPLNVPTDVHFLELNVPIDENFYYANEEQSIQNHFFADMEPPAGTSRSFETPQQNGNIMAIGTGAISSTFLPSPGHIQGNINYGQMDSSLMVHTHTAQEKSQYIDFSSSTNSLTILKSCAQQFECGSAKTIVRKSSKPKKKQTTKTKEFISKETGIKQTQISTNPLITETAAEPSSELDKIAKRLFSKQSTITLEFNDQLAFEFSTLMGRCSQLLEQKEAGINVDAELKMVEVRIADYISTAESTKNRPGNHKKQKPVSPGKHLMEEAGINVDAELKMVEVRIADYISTAETSTKNRSRNHKKQKPVIQVDQKEQIVVLIPETSTSQSSTKEKHDISAGKHVVERCYIQKDPMDLSNSMGYVTFRHGEEGRRAMEQLNGFELAGRNIRVTSVDEEVLVKTEEPKKIETQQCSLEAEDRNINSSSRLQLMANLAKGKEDVKVPKITQEAIAAQQAHQQNADNIPTFATQCFMLSNMFDHSNETEVGWDLDIRDDVIEECKTHGVIVQETQEEVEARNAHQREKRKKSLTEQFEKMHQQTNIQDYQSSFANKFDCIQRLLPFGLFIEPEFGHDFLYKFDAEIQRHSELMLERQKSIEKRLRSIMFRQAMVKMETEQNLLLFLDGYYIKEQFRREIIEKDPTYLDKVEHLVDTSNCKPELDWEFNEWSPDLYTNIPPFTPPIQEQEQQHEWSPDLYTNIPPFTPPIQEQEQQHEWSPDLYTNIPPFTPPIQEQEQQQTHIPGGSIEHLVDTSNCKPELDGEFNEWSPELIQPFTPPIQEQEQQQTHIPGGSMLKLRISKEMLQTNNSTRNIQQIEEKKEERKARKKRKRETKKRKIVIERDEMKDDEIKEEEPIMKIPRIKIRFGNSIKHKDPQQQQPSPTILSTIPSTSSIMTPLFASQTFEEPPRPATTINFQEGMEFKMESQRVQFSPSCSENDPVGSMLKLRISKQMLHENSTSNIQIEEKKEERKARKKRKRETKKRKIVIERDEMKDDEIKEEEPIMKIPRIKIRFGNSIKHKDPQQQQPSPTILSTIPSTSSIMTPLFASQTFEEPPRPATTINFQEGMEFKMESQRVQFSPSCSENDPVGSMLKLRISKQMLHENSTSNIQIEEKKEERKARKKRKRETKKRKIVIERDEMKDDEIKEEEPIMKIPRIKIRFGNSVKHKDPEQQPSPTILSTIPSTSSIMTPLFASQTFDEPPQTDQKDEMELKLESKRVQFSPCCSEDESESELRQRTDKLLSRIDRLHC